MEAQRQRRPGEWGTKPERRRRILDAALECFDAKGVAATTIEDICAGAGLSVGSIYHHSRARTTSSSASSRRRWPSTGRGSWVPWRAERASSSLYGAWSRFHVGWVEDRPALTKLMLRWEEAERARPTGHDHYDEYSESIGAWLREQAHAGKIRRMEPDLYSTLFMGPLMEHARQRTAGITVAAPKTLERGLVEGLLRVVAP